MLNSPFAESHFWAEEFNSDEAKWTCTWQVLLVVGQIVCSVVVDPQYFFLSVSLAIAFVTVSQTWAHHWNFATFDIHSFTVAFGPITANMLIKISSWSMLRAAETQSGHCLILNDWKFFCSRLEQFMLVNFNGACWNVRDSSVLRYAVASERVRNTPTSTEFTYIKPQSIWVSNLRN